MRIRRLSLLFVLSFQLTGSLRAQDANSPQKFVESLYTHYRSGQHGIAFSGPDASKYYHSSLLALEREDERLVGPEYVGAIDADPICACQDWEGIWNLRIEVRMESASRASVSVSFSLNRPPSSDVQHLQMILTVENGAWRIYDIRDVTNPRMPFDVRGALEAEIQELRAKNARRRKNSSR